MEKDQNDLCDWEWHYLLGLGHQKELALMAHYERFEWVGRVKIWPIDANADPDITQGILPEYET